MNKIIKLLWLITSYALLYLVCGIALLINGIVNKFSLIAQIGWVLIAITFLSIIGCVIVVLLAKKKLSRTKMNIVEASSKDGDMLANTLAYLSPMITLSFENVNYWMLGGLVVVIVVLTMITRAAIMNPLLYLMKYKYYTIKAKSGISYTLISKKRRLNLNNVGDLIEIFDEVYLEV